MAKKKTENPVAATETQRRAAARVLKAVEQGKMPGVALLSNALKLEGLSEDEAAQQAAEMIARTRKLLEGDPTLEAWEAERKEKGHSN